MLRLAKINVITGNNGIDDNQDNEKYDVVLMTVSWRGLLGVIVFVRVALRLPVQTTPPLWGRPLPPVIYSGMLRSVGSPGIAAISLIMQFSGHSDMIQK